MYALTRLAARSRIKQQQQQHLQAIQIYAASMRIRVH